MDLYQPNSNGNSAAQHLDLHVCEVRSSINVGRANDTANRLLGFGIPGVSYRLCHKYLEVNVKGRVNFVVTA